MSANYNKLNLQQFFLSCLEITSVDDRTTELWISLRSRTTSFHCPNCGVQLRQLHGTHRRTVQDLPILGKRVMLALKMHEFQCTNEACHCGAVSETIDGFLNYYSRMTERLVDFVTMLALETSCESCARILQAMNVRISGDTVIRMLLKRYSEQPEPVCGHTIGIDDFAFKKGHTDGTILVDESTHRPIALLDGRDGNRLKEWLRKNKQVTTVTRDRACAYAKAVDEILPDCMQIADRFHLHQNLMTAVNKILSREIPTATMVLCDESTAQEEASTNKLDADKKNWPNCRELNGI